MWYVLSCYTFACNSWHIYVGDWILEENTFESFSCFTILSNNIYDYICRRSAFKRWARHKRIPCMFYVNTVNKNFSPDLFLILLIHLLTCCAHVASIWWYLYYQKYVDKVKCHNADYLNCIPETTTSKWP